LRKILTWIVLAPVFAVLISFAISNRETLVLRLWPTSYELAAPAFLVGLGGLFLGFLWGAVVVWIAGGEARARARRANARAEMAEREAEHLKAEIADIKDRARKAAAGDAGRLPASAAGEMPASVPRIL